MFLALLLFAATPESGDLRETPPRYECVTFLAIDCPMAQRYASRLRALAARYPQVRFRGVSANQQDSCAAVARFGRQLRFPFEQNLDEIVRLGATRSPETFLLVDGEVVYQGRIDDQFTPGANRSQPTRRDLEEAISEVLAGQPVSVPRTKATGCHITLPREQSGDLTFEDVAPILHTKCAACHRPGEVAPFSLLTYDEVIGWTAMIREVVDNGRMPPWSASPQHGRFANDRSLTSDEKDRLTRWIDAGAPAGKRHPIPPRFDDGWKIRPDLVLTIQQPFAVPADGVLDYQDFVLEPGFTHDTWIQAVELRPGNRAVVHHINVYLRPKNGEADTHLAGEMNDGYLATAVPGNTVTDWPVGVAKVVPAGFQVVLSIHYQPNGLPQQDQSSIAFQIADAQTVRQQAATRVLLKEDLKLPPNSVTTAAVEWTLEDDYTLLALYPHMHLRGRSMRFEVVHPQAEVLLDVPQFDFNWQSRYVLAEPKPLQAGTVLRCVAVYDNTAANPNNPDPSATVVHGKQSSDEMFQACFEIVRTQENRLQQSRTATLPALMTLMVALIGLSVARRRRLRAGAPAE